VPVLQFVVNAEFASRSPFLATLCDLIVMAFFFLLRPGEYVASSSDSAAPFRFQDVHLFAGRCKLDLSATTDAALWSATYVALEFSSQKNGVKGELIGLGKSGHDFWCPVRAVIRRVLHLRRHRAAAPTPLHCFFDRNANHWLGINSAHVTAHLRGAVLAIGASYGITAPDITARALRCSGAMAMLCADIDTDRIRLIGRWRSDEMFRYLHTQAAPVTSQLSRTMLAHGTFVLVPNTPHAQLVQALT
jgi:hypothetical protein